MVLDLFFANKEKRTIKLDKIYQTTNSSIEQEG